MWVVGTRVQVYPTRMVMTQISCPSSIGNRDGYEILFQE